ncbi:MAG TPA: cytochrome C oxidase subunit II [Candidatus Angelobacter sp.]|nr:cytochrome C oxidase subunit II [Candidatus Angelobacter sp.]
MSTVLRLAIVAIALASAGLFLVHPWWFPAAASAQSAALDRRFYAALWILGGLFLLSQTALVLVLSRSQAEDKHSSWYGNWKIEVAWALVITVIFFGFNISGEHLWSRMTSPGRTADALQVEVTGVQFQWYFRYPGADGVLGRVQAAKFARPDEGNPLGIDPTDPTGRDDIVSSALVLPVDRPVDLILRAQDVIHSVFIPEMRFKRDAVPGMDIHAGFTPTRTGSYELVCTQLCGLGHHRMRALVRVVSEAEFKQWLKVQSSARLLSSIH